MELFSISIYTYIDLLNYMLKYKIPQIVTLIPSFCGKMQCRKK